MTRIAFGGAFGAVLATGIWLANFAASAHAQTPAMNDLRGKIFDAKMAQQTFAAGLKHCSELNGTNFYFEARDRVLMLEDFHRSLDSLAQGGGFNPATKRPWNQQDADARWQDAQAQALKDKATCALVASLPDLEKQLAELRRAAAANAAPMQK
ncbi:MAG TPA: hypothetical protein VEK75_15905 [Xanthobacteraceae bacterium]|nr:hypothetical protein [Xanthobacteraceae bacterium]